jgi:chromosome segregation ATPase
LKDGESPKLVGIFECANCKARFRSVVDDEAELKETVNPRNTVERIGGVKGGLTQALASLREKINTLETERASLMSEIVKLRKVAQSRVDAIESEVSMLRNDVESLRALLGYKAKGEP